MSDAPFKPIVWLWIPIAWMIGQLALEATLDVTTLQIIHSEAGVHECLQFFLVAIACIVAVRTLWRMDRKQDYLLTTWVAIAAICSFYVAAEEMSWGQSVLHWPTPEEWAAINGQQETNLHNTSRWLNHIPRYVLEVGVLVGGIILPLILTYKPHWIPARFTIFIPPRQLWVIAALVVFAVVGGKLSKELFDGKLFARGSEVEEIFLFYFVLLYMIALSKRLLNRSAA